MQPPITDRDTLDRIVELDARAGLALAHCDEREAEIADLRERQSRLQSRLIAEQDNRPVGGVGEDLAEALIADPDVQLSTSARASLRTARDRSAASLGDHQATTGVVATAIAKLDERIGEAEASLATERAGAAVAWREFVEAAYDAMAVEFREAFIHLRNATLAPLLALAEAYCRAPCVGKQSRQQRAMQPLPLLVRRARR